MSLGRTTDLSVDIDGDATGYERAVASAERATLSAQRSVMSYDLSLKTLGMDIARLEKQLDDDLTAALDRQHAAMTKTGRGMLLFGGLVAAGLALAGREAMQWESAWTGVRKTVDGTPEQLDALEQELRDLTKVLPASHEEIAAVAEAAGQLGVAVPDIAAFTKTMIDLATTTDLTADAAATEIAKLMNVMKSAPEDVDNLGSALVALGNNGASTEGQILSLAQRLSGAGQLIGASESDVLALASAMSDLGIEAELGGGAASRALTKMYAAVASGGDKLESFAETAGMTADQFAAAFGEDPIRALDAYVKGLGRIDAEGGNVVQALEAVSLGGTQNMQVLLRLSGAGDRLTNSLELSSQAWEENIALVAEAEQRYDTAESRAKMAMNTITDGAISIGGTVLPIFAQLVDFVANIATAFGDLPGPLKAALTILALAAAAFALVGGAALTAIPKIAAFRTAVLALEAGALRTMGLRLLSIGGLLMGPWGLALAAGVTALTIFASKQGAAAREIEEVKGTLDRQTGAVTENTAAWLTKKFVEDGVIDRAKALGLSLDLVARAALGESDAIAELNGMADEHGAAMENILGSLTDVTDAREGETFATIQQNAANAQQSAAIRDLLGDLGLYSGKIEAARDQLDLQAAVTKAVTGDTEDAGDAATGTAGAFGDLADESEELTDQIDALKDAFEALSGGFLSEREASRAVRDQLREVRKAMREYRKEHGDLVGAFKKGTKSGDEFQGMLDDLAKKLQDQVTATLQRTGSEKAANRVLRESKKTLFEVAREMGMTKEAARLYVEQVLGIPKIVDTDIQNNADQAARQAERYKRILDDLNGRRVTTWIANKIDSPDGPGVNDLGANSDADTSRPKNTDASTPSGAERTLTGTRQRSFLSGPIVGPNSDAVLQGAMTSSSSPTSVTATLDGPLEITGLLSIDKSGRVFLTGIADDSALRTVQGARDGANVKDRMRYP